MIQLRHLRLRSFTATRAFGADIPFEAGLNVVQAPNTSGKSTCLQAIIYALGLERSLGPQLTVPLPYAMREQIHQFKEDPYDLVLQSYVELEIANAQGEIVVLHRDVVGDKSTKLIQTWNGPSLSSEIPRGEQRDYFVLDGGSATNESGFHAFLAQFLDWDLPIVARYDGTECPLYLEAIFPMLFVEQKRGWSSIQGPFPTFLRIQDVARRVMEFLLDLETAKNRRRRAELRAAISELLGRWSDRRKGMEEAAARVGRIRGLAVQPSAEFAAAPTLDLQLYYEGEWTRLADVLQIATGRVAELEASQVETVEQAAPDIQARVTDLRSQLDALSAVLEAVRGEYGAETQDNAALEERVAALETDLKRNQDAQRLQRLGSELGRAASEHVCPTCHQGVSNELLPTVDSVGMALDENITFLKSQLELYRSALLNSRERLQEIAARYRGSERDLQDKQQQLRVLRQELTRPSASPSRAAIEEIVRLQAFIDRLESIDGLANSLLDELREIASEWALATSNLRKLPADELTVADKRKIEHLQSAIRRHLERYGFRSFQPGEISLSYDNFRPLVLRNDKGETVEKEINFEMSASDAIRLKWAYYLSCMELMRDFSVNHPGLTIFDEPGQQEVESSSLFEFLRSASQSAQNGQQVLVSTSETYEAVSATLGDSANIVSFPGFILQPIETGSAS
ncbi:chromosome segregation protein [Novosphingobium resinovorum]|uniref:Chromosome segregation protein n=1 Tax=Novosphingobium resinovorum TaxID=158500 RepID=A0A031JY77_9SPHN|nr:AAA family ATPase [Novosphingobium resinovorum]EZP81864.1 chromosome segregation protein [Novosphingobium resinovorum]